MTVRTDTAPVRERLLATADQLFYREGLHAVGIDRIIAESGVAKSTMYVHFRTKEDLIEEYLRRRSDLMHQRITAELHNRSEQSAGERILAVFDVLADETRKSDYRGCAFVNAAAEYPQHGGIQSAIAYDRAWLPQVFTELAAEAGSPGPEGLAQMLVQLYDGANVAAHLDSSTTSAETARSIAENLLVRSL